MAAQTFYVCQGGDGTNPTAGVAATAWDADDISANNAHWANPKEDGKIGPGDTVYFMSDGGTIKGTGAAATGTVTVWKSGNAGSPITFTGDGSAVISGEGGTPTVGERLAFKVEERDYLTIENLEICYGYARLVRLYDCENIIVQNCHLHHCTTDGDKAILMSGNGTNWTIRYNDFHDCEEEHLFYASSRDDGNPSSNILLEYNTFARAAETNVTFNGKDEFFTGIVVRYNWFEDPGYDDIILCSTDSAEIHGNIFVHTTTSKDIAIRLGDDSQGTAHVKNTKIWNNTFYGVYNVMMDLSGVHGAEACISEYKNNILYFKSSGGGGSYYWYLRASDGSAVVTAMDYNLYHADVACIWQDEADNTYATLALWKAGSGLDTNSVESDPLFTDAANDVFTLQAGSPAKTTGVLGGPAAGLNIAMRKTDFGRGGNVTLTAFGTTPAMGAYAYGDPSAWVMIYG